MENNNITFDKIVLELNKVKEWLSNLRIKNLDKSRLPNIIKYASQLELEYLKYYNRQPNKLINLSKDIEVAVYEALSLITIYKGFSKMNQNHLPKKKLEKCLLGTFSSLEESPNDNSNQARNTLFELETNAYVKLCGLDVTNEYEDVNILINKYKVSIQCKRPLSEQQIEPNITDAYSQLIKNNSIKDNPYSYGLIALSWEKLYELDKIRSVSNHSELNKFIGEIYNDIMPKVKPCWDRIKNTKLLGLMFYFKSPIVFKDIGALYAVNIFNIFFPLPPLNRPSPRWEIFSNLHKLNNIKLGEREAINKLESL